MAEKKEKAKAATGRAERLKEMVAFKQIVTGNGLVYGLDEMGRVWIFWSTKKRGKWILADRFAEGKRFQFPERVPEYVGESDWRQQEKGS